MKNIVAFALLLGLSFSQIAGAVNFSQDEETSITCVCDKCGKKDCHGSCKKKEAKSCKKGEKSCKKKRSCCKKKGKSCKKKEEKTDEDKK